MWYTIQYFGSLSCLAYLLWQFHQKQYHLCITPWSLSTWPANKSHFWNYPASDCLRKPWLVIQIQTALRLLLAIPRTSGWLCWFSTSLNMLNANGLTFIKLMSFDLLYRDYKGIKHLYNVHFLRDSRFYMLGIFRVWNAAFGNIHSLHQIPSICTYSHQYSSMFVILNKI